MVYRSVLLWISSAISIRAAWIEHRPRRVASRPERPRRAVHVQGSPPGNPTVPPVRIVSSKTPGVLRGRTKTEAPTHADVPTPRI
jgi:hypothetical protein